MAPKPKKAVVTTTTTTTWKDPGTLGSDEEVPMFDESDSDGEAPVAAPKGKKKVAAAAAAASAAKGNRPSGGLNPSFKFEADSGIESAWDFSMAKSFASGSNRRGTSVNEKIKQRLLQPTSLQPKAPKRKRGEEDEEGEEDDDEDEDEEDEDEDEEGEDEEGDEDDDDDDEEGDEDDEEGDEDDDDDDDDDDKLEDADEEDEKPSKKHKAKQDNEDEEDEEDDDIAKAKQARKDAFFSSAPNSGSDSSASETFVGLNLSRPIMRALTQLGFDKPTPIQSQTIPLAMQGLDICASAVTGSGIVFEYSLSFP